MPDVIVIGAGAAGLTAAIRAAEGGAETLALNAHPSIGLKILMSGGTRCNVTHATVNARDFEGGSRNVIARILRAFDSNATRAWFEQELKVPLKLEETGKLFPESDDAQTVLDAMLAAASRAGVKVRNSARAVRLKPVGEHWRVGIVRVGNSAELGAEAHAFGGAAWPLPAAEPTEWLDTRRVVLASGGLSFPRTGSDGTGYALAAALGHTIVPPVPALTPLTSTDELCKSVQGVTLDATLSLWSGGKRVASATGSFLFAHFGYSGPAALDLSRHWQRADPGSRRVTVSFAPGGTREALLADWLALATSDPARTVRRHLGAWLPDRLAHELSWQVEIDPARPLSQVAKPRRDALITLLLERDLHVTGTLGYEKAEVTAGGVALGEVDASTLESRLVKGLFLCGEVLDVEGRLGGFNFQWAWSSGTVAGRSAMR